MKSILKALFGLILIFLFHLPRMLWLLLQISYAYVFNPGHTLTADPSEHLKRARRMLRRNRLDQLLYAALEIRFALERMVHWEAVFADDISRKQLKQPDPVKKRKALSRLDPAIDSHHKIFLINPETGERFEWGEYKPIDIMRINEIQGKLGNLLHPKYGLKLGIPEDGWYKETRAFLVDSLKYLTEIHKANSPFYGYKDLNNFVLEKCDD